MAATSPGAGVTSAIAGEREIPRHELPSYTEGTCGADEGEADANASRAIASKSNLTATVVLKDGALHAEVIGIIGDQKTVTLPRSNHSYVRFVNLDDETHRMVVDLGAEIVVVNGTNTKQPEQLCTQAVGKDGAQFIVVRPTRPSASSDVPFTFTVPGINDSVTIVVP